MAQVWTARTTPWDDPFADIEKGCWSPDLGMFCVGGSNAGSTACILTSTDGTTWTQQTTPADASSGFGGDVCWSPSLGLLVCALSTSGNVINIMSSPNGTAWTHQPTPADGTATTAYVACLTVAWSASLGLFVAGFEQGSGGTAEPRRTR